MNRGTIKRTNGDTLVPSWYSLPAMGQSHAYTPLRHTHHDVLDLRGEKA
jgi:hypothetical protein